MIAQVGCNTAGYLRQSLYRALDGIAMHNIRYVEFGSIPGYIEHVLPDSPAKARDLRNSLDSRNLVPISVSAGADLATEDGYAFIEHWLRFGSEMGMKFVNTGTGPGSPNGRKDAVVRNLRRLGKVAESTNVYVALETQDDLTASAGAAKELLAAVDSSWVCLNLDAANMLYWQGIDPLDEIEGLAPYVRHVHIKDKIGGRGEYNFPPLGGGEIDWSVILTALSRSDFDGPIVIDPEVWREEAKTKAEIDEARRDPSMTYRRPHGYLGVDDPTIVDKYISTTLAALDGLFNDLHIASDRVAQ